MQNLISQQCHGKPSSSLGFLFLCSVPAKLNPLPGCQGLVLKATKGRGDLSPSKGFWK